MTTIDVNTPDGQMPAHLWLPDSGSGPGILLVQEIFGVSDYIRNRESDLAAAGYVVLAPELYWRLDQQQADATSQEGLQKAMGLMSQLDWATTVADSVAALERLAGLDEVRAVPGVMGFCFGGGVAFDVAAVAEPSVLVSYYGSALPQLLDLVPKVTCPSLHHFGTADDYIPIETVQTISAALTAGSPPAEVELHGGANHAFDNPDFAFHHPQASEQAWQQTMTFLRKELPA